MVFGWFRKKPHEAVIARLHGEIMAQARNPVLFTDYGVADTPEGRFEMVALHVLAAVRGLAAQPEPGPELAQELTDAMFTHVDIAFREMGVSDTTVPKRMKKYASAWLGRARVYGSALDAGDAAELAKALARNVHGEVETTPAEAHRLARYLMALEKSCRAASLAPFAEGPPPAIDPASIT